MSGPTVGGGGLGRYVEQLLMNLRTIDHQNRYLLFGRKELWKTEQHHTHWNGMETSIPWYTIKEQWALPKLMDTKRLDLIHFPHWNVPIRLKTPFVVTIHDLILLEEPTSARVTTKHPLIFALKFAGFKCVLAHAVQASKQIIAVSQATKSDILKQFPTIPANKISVIYEGVTTLSSSALQSDDPQTHDISTVPTLLYVGNCYPHKNLSTLLQAFELMHQSLPNLHLIFAGREDVFSKRLEQQTQTLALASFIKFVKNPTDAELAQLYLNCQVYVFPSRIEGFGLPPLEAMHMGTPVACSDIPSLREILGTHAVYFSPTDPKDMAKKISELLNDTSNRKERIRRAKEHVQQYSWTTMSKQIIKIYESCAS